VARALIVGCGCRGRTLAKSLVAAGWQVRGTTRDRDRTGPVAATGTEAVVADPDRLGTLVDHLADVTLVFWLLASAAGEPEAVRALHDERLESLLQKLVDTPVRGFVYERAGSVAAEHLARGDAVVRLVGERWRIPVEVVDSAPTDHAAWRRAMEAAAARLAGPR
jgi:nucleoside-diphosphate-sugar epimerase